jgi:hypothetical protein
MYFGINLKVQKSGVELLTIGQMKASADLHFLPKNHPGAAQEPKFEYNKQTQQSIDHCHQSLCITNNSQYTFFFYSISSQNYRCRTTLQSA